MNIGAIAGFAAVVGLAVLAMLYFSQARDVRRLREWAGREPERAAEIELRAQQIASQAIAQAYQSMAVRQSEASAAAGIAQEQGVEVVEPLEVDEAEAVEHDAVIAADDPNATQAHDVVGEEFGEEGAVVEGEQVEHAEDDQLEHGEEAEHVEEDADAEHEVVAEQVSPNGTAEHEVAAASAAPNDTAVQPAPVEGGEGEATSRLAPSTPAAARAAAPLPPLPPLDTSEFSAVGGTPPTPPIPDYYLSTGTTGSGAFAPVDPPNEGRSRVPFAVAGVLVAIFAVILIATQIGGGTEEPQQKTAAEKRDERLSQAAPSGERNPEINRPAVTISVLNGTPTSGLAKLAADALAKTGFTDVTSGNRNDGVNHPSSTVYYADGSKLEAQEVAKELDVKDVKEADEDILAAGGSVPVIVVLGADFDQ